jgi:hypothetical protein
VVDVSNPQAPVQVAIVPEGANAVALRGRLALIGTGAAVRLLDLTTPASPVTLWSRTDLKIATAVAFGDRTVLVHLTSQLRRLDSNTGADLGVLQVGSCDSLAVRGDLIYVLADNMLTICRDADYLELVGTVNARAAAGPEDGLGDSSSPATSSMPSTTLDSMSSISSIRRPRSWPRIL